MTIPLGSSGGEPAPTGDPGAALCLPSPQASLDTLRNWFAQFLPGMLAWPGSVELTLAPGRSGRLEMSLRVAGEEVAHEAIQAAASAWLLSHIKKLAGLQVGERRVPQRGRIVLQGQSHGVLVETLPPEPGEGLGLESIRVAQEPSWADGPHGPLRRYFR